MSQRHRFERFIQFYIEKQSGRVIRNTGAPKMELALHMSATLSRENSLTHYYNSKFLKTQDYHKTRFPHSTRKSKFQEQGPGNFLQPQNHGFGLANKKMAKKMTQSTLILTRTRHCCL